MKKLLCLCLSTIMLLALIPAAHAEGAVFDQFNENGDLHWTQIPIVSEALLETEQVTIGGEGCQWPLGISTSYDGSIVMLGTDVGGIFRSIDGGRTYTPANAGLHCHGGSAFAIDPNNNDRILLVGVGSKFFSMCGIYLSTDRGNTWNQQLKTAIDGVRDIRDSVAYDPSSFDEGIGGSAIAYYSVLFSDAEKQDVSKMGLYKSADGGSTWELINSELYNCIVKVGSDGTVYAANDTTLFSSGDGGASWTECYTGEITGFDFVKDTYSESDKLVICDKIGIIISTDGINFTRSDAVTYPTADNVSGLGGYAQNVMISPADSNYMLVCYVRADHYNNVNYYTHDGGITWLRSHYSNDYNMVGKVGGRVCTYAWVGNDKNTVYAFGGDMITSSKDGGARFDWDCNGFNAILVGGEFHFNVYDSDIMYFGAQDYNGAVTADGGRSWKYINFSGKGWGGNCYGGYAADESTYFVGVSPSWAGDREICITYDAGKTIVHTGVTYSVTDGVLPRGIESAYQSPTDPNVFFQTFFRSPDGGRSWTKMTDCIGVYGHDTDSGRLFGIDTTRHYIVFSDDEGVTWQHLNTEPIGTNYMLGDLSVDSKNDIVYVAYGQKCIGKINYDGTWSCILSKEMNTAPINDRGALILNCVAVDPNHPEVIYCGGSADYYMNTSSTLRSTDSGATWQCVTPNTVNSIISPESIQSGYETCSMTVDPETSMLWAAGGCLGFAKLSSPCNDTDTHMTLKREPVTVTYKHGSSVFMTDVVGTGLCAVAPSKAPNVADKVFNGWFTDESCTKEFDFNLRLNSDITLYAGFVDKLTIAFRSGDNVEYSDVGQGHLLENQKAPEYDGLCFAGWFTDKARTVLYDFSSPVANSMTLYAGFYENLYDSSVRDYSAYIANSTHSMSSTSRINDSETVSNRVTPCMVEAGKTYGISIDMDCRFRVGAVEAVKSGVEITNYFQDELDTNSMSYIGQTRRATITTNEGQTTLLIFYWTTYTGCTDFLQTKNSICVYDPSVVIIPPGNEDEPTTEPTSEATTEPTTQPQSRPLDPDFGKEMTFLDKLTAFIQRIIIWFTSLFK